MFLSLKPGEGQTKSESGCLAVTWNLRLKFRTFENLTSNILNRLLNILNDTMGKKKLTRNFLIGALKRVENSTYDARNYSS